MKSKTENKMPKTLGIFMLGLLLVSVSVAASYSSTEIEVIRDKDITIAPSLQIQVLEQGIACILEDYESCGLIRDAKVSLYAREGKFIRSESTRYGYANFFGLEKGDYVAVVQAKGFEYTKEKISYNGDYMFTKIYISRVIDEPVNKYDINGDNRVDLLDVNTVFNCVLGKCDFDQDGKVTNRDIKMLRDAIKSDLADRTKFDINEDGKINELDVAGVSSYASGKTDVNGDGKTTIEDALEIAKHMDYEIPTEDVEESPENPIEVVETQIELIEDSTEVVETSNEEIIYKR